MAGLTFKNVAKDLLIAWAISVGVIFVCGTVFYGIIVGLAMANHATNGEDMGFGLIGLGIAYFLGILAAQKYLKRRGFVRAGMIAWLSAAIGLVLPIGGSLLAFLFLGFPIERSARRRP